MIHRDEKSVKWLGTPAGVVFTCPFCKHDVAAISRSVAAHLSVHGMVGRMSERILRCACGFEGSEDEMVTHWQDGDTKHAATCVLGDLGGAVEVVDVWDSTQPYAYEFPEQCLSLGMVR